MDMERPPLPACCLLLPPALPREYLIRVKKTRCLIYHQKYNTVGERERETRFVKPIVMAFFSYSSGGGIFIITTLSTGIVTWGRRRRSSMDGGMNNSPGKDQSAHANVTAVKVLLSELSHIPHPLLPSPPLPSSSTWSSSVRRYSHVQWILSFGFFIACCSSSSVSFCSSSHYLWPELFPGGLTPSCPCPVAAVACDDVPRTSLLHKTRSRGKEFPFRCFKSTFMNVVVSSLLFMAKTFLHVITKNHSCSPLCTAKWMV